LDASRPPPPTRFIQSYVRRGVAFHVYSRCAGEDEQLKSIPLRLKVLMHAVCYTYASCIVVRRIRLRRFNLEAQGLHPLHQPPDLLRPSFQRRLQRFELSWTIRSSFRRLLQRLRGFYEGLHRCQLLFELISSACTPAALHHSKLILTCSTWLVRPLVRESPNPPPPYTLVLNFSSSSNHLFSTSPTSGR
jgi:hypothetical protein